jgi:AhpC/TSA family protein
MNPIWGKKKTPEWGIDNESRVRDKKSIFCEYFPPEFVLKKGKAMKPIERVLLGLVLAASFLLATIGSAAALEVGQKAPDFELDSSRGGKLKLSDLKGKNVVINFYVLDFSPT